jgi:hypothetical protein
MTIINRACEYFIFRIQDKITSKSNDLYKLFSEAANDMMEGDGQAQDWNQIASMKEQDENRTIDLFQKYDKIKMENKKKIIKAILQESIKSEAYDITMLTLNRFILELDDSDVINFIYFVEN